MEAVEKLASKKKWKRREEKRLSSMYVVGKRRRVKAKQKTDYRGLLLTPSGSFKLRKTFFFTQQASGVQWHKKACSPSQIVMLLLEFASLQEPKSYCQEAFKQIENVLSVLLLEKYWIPSEMFALLALSHQNTLTS